MYDWSGKSIPTERGEYDPPVADDPFLSDSVEIRPLRPGDFSLQGWADPAAPGGQP